jgi:hypothetical protein
MAYMKDSTGKRLDSFEVADKAELSATYAPATGSTAYADKSVEAAVAAKASSADVIPIWKATTAYLAGDKVISPAGEIVSAKANFTSGASFSAANWNYVPAKSLVDSDVTLSRVLNEQGVPELKTTNRISANVYRLGTNANALQVVDVPGTNGRRWSLEPLDQSNSTASSQLQIIPGANVSPAEVTAQILIYNKTGANYERFVTSAFNGEYQFHSSRLGTGLCRPTFFYADNVPVTAWMEDATFRVYKQLDFYDQASTSVWGSLKAYAADVIGTGAKFRVDEGGAGQIRLGDTAALGRPTILMGTDGTVNINRNAGDIEVSGANLKMAAGKVVKHGTTTTASRPSASTVGAGAQIYDTTLSKPIYSDGTVWRDAMGTAV